MPGVLLKCNAPRTISESALAVQLIVLKYLNWLESVPYLNKKSYIKNFYYIIGDQNNIFN
ncbi:ubiquinone biosynthesis protein UbiE [Aphanothece sacrum FPU1]|uniref:Ubiquinone biosynthesis protein UbiE n=1 Tax=Aphanothece sacrum FPU1 TaxID=1920663 RepID=A0A401IJF1_APHSA|nr:ubiquinone biosynthesis protein UbiE [Aphanothece sacrum FPU1]GBF86124.1 ubiquinone biosynthesis protein UbiE [Aphanothece sacrum FPU3]